MYGNNYLLLKSPIIHLTLTTLANLITVTAWNKLSNNEQLVNTAATPITISVARIISVQTRPVAYQTTGITNIMYNLGVNNMTYQINLIVTEAVAAIITAANAAT